MKHYLSILPCPCGAEHRAAVEDLVIGKGALQQLPGLVKKYGTSRPFLLADKNTFAAGGSRVCALLEEAGIPWSSYIFPQTSPEPDEASVGSAVMHFDHRCDLVIGIGSGVINDIGKLLSHIRGCRYIIVATAPSMDGYASATSSMSMDGLKVSLNSRCADGIIGDTDILKTAPDHMLRSGLGDMLAKYVSIAEWRIAHLITGEYYCPQVAQLIRGAVKKCVDNAPGLLRREDAALGAVFEGLVIGGIAMAYAGVSRPASGVEHYFSHVWDMRGLEFGTPVDLHGIQCAMGTRLAVRLYDAVRAREPDWDTALAWPRSFDREAWNETLRSFLGPGAEAMIAQEEKDGKYDPAKHPARLLRIRENWDSLLKILEEELPSAEALDGLMRSVGLPLELEYLGIDKEQLRLTFQATRDIRDKYVLSRLAWDLGITERLCQLL